MFQWLTGVSLLTMAVVSSKAQVIFSDGFESGVDSSVWTAQSTLFVEDSARVKVGAKAAKTLTQSGRMWHIVSYPTSTSAKISFWFYDGTIAGSSKQLSGVYTWTGGTWGGGVGSEFCLVGRYNGTPDWTFNGVPDPVNTAKYQGRFTRVAFNSTVGTTGYFTMVGGPNRSVGWHRAEIIRGLNDDSTVTVSFYIDGLLGRSFTNNFADWGNTPWNFATVGANAGSAADDYSVDDYAVLNGQPYISTQPSDTSVTQGQPLSLTANAIGNATLTYQWKKNGVNIPGATDLTLNISGAADPTNAGNYTLVASNSVDIGTSRTAVVTVTPLIQILTQPVGTRVNLGETATISVSASGNGTLLYQWRKDGVNLPGQTDSVLTIPNAAVTNQGTYTVWVTNDVHDPGMLSSGAGLQVNTAPQIVTSNMNLAMSTTGFEIPVSITDDYSSNPVPFITFEGINNGASKMFNQPSFSSSSSACIDITTGNPNFTYVTNLFPAGHAGSKVLMSSWVYTNPPTTNGDWLRLSSNKASTSDTNWFNPIIGTNKLRFDIYSEKNILLAIGVRETNPTGAYGQNGGSSGPIELIGYGQGYAPWNPYRTINANTWTTVEFDTKTDFMISFSSGNGKIDSTTGKVVLEMLELTVDPSEPTPGLEKIYVDNFVVPVADPVTFTLDSGPAGATIDPVTGIISWQAPGVGTYNFTVSVKDTGSFITSDSGLTTSKSFSVTVVNAPPSSPKLNYTYNKPNLSLTWTNASFALESADVVTGPWTTITGATTGFTTNATSAAKFFRLKY